MTVREGAIVSEESACAYPAVPGLVCCAGEFLAD